MGEWIKKLAEKYAEVNEAKKKDKGDMDNDGIHEPDDKEYMDNKDKAIKKAMNKENSSETATMSPVKKDKKTKNSETETMTQESTLPPVYARIIEKRAMHNKGATEPEGLLDKESPASKKFIDTHKANMTPDDTEEKGHDDASKAGRAGPNAAARSGDNKAGDKAVINKLTQKQ